VGAGISRAKQLLFLGAAVVSFASASAVAQDRSGPRSAADRAMVEGERTYQEALRLRAQDERAESDRMLRAAEAKFRSVLRLDPARAEAAIRVSIILYASNRSREAVPILEAALRGSPDRNDLKHQLGIHLLALNRTAEALALLAAVTQADPELYDAHLLLARHYYRTRDYDKAVERFSAYIRSRPGALADGDAEVYGSIGNAHLAMERYPEARAQYQKVLQVSERNLPARINIAFAYFQEGNYREAVTRYESLLRLGEPHPIVLANLHVTAQIPKPSDSRRRSAITVLTSSSSHSSQTIIPTTVQPRSSSRAHFVQPRLR
jgi:tetratricopeptide (TPR) repeat protein